MSEQNELSRAIDRLSNLKPCRCAECLLKRAGPELLAALISTRKLVSEAAMTGFNCHDGDWAERLFANQAALTVAIRKATEPRP